MTSPRRRRLGQHFLNHPQLAEKMVKLAELTPDDQVFEIGPGRGMLTEALAACCRVVCVETDPKLARELGTRFDGRQNVTILHDDILKFDFNTLNKPNQSRWKVVANLPYSISTEIIFRLIEHRHLFSELYLMVQKEVANRLVATPGGKAYGILAVLTQLYSESRAVMKVPPGAFKPPPQVDSTVVAMKLSDEPRVPVADVKKFKQLVRQAFSTRRKMLKNALQGLSLPAGQTWDDLLGSNGIQPKARAEELSLEEFSQLSDRWQQLS